MNKFYLYRVLLLCTGILALAFPVADAQTIVGIPKFNNPLPVPEPVNALTLNLSLESELHSFDPNAVAGGRSPWLRDSVVTFAFNFFGATTNQSNTFLGPTLIWTAKELHHIAVTNNIGEASSVHWHGAHVPPQQDGGPHTPIADGATWNIDVTVRDSACTLWYHPHAEGITLKQVEMGLAGIIIVRDTIDALRDLLPHTYGHDDFPLIIDSRKFNKNGVNGCVGTPYCIDSARHSANNQIPMVNGVRFPFLDIPPQPVRLRILDGSGRNCYKLSVCKRSGGQDTYLPMKLIAADAGYLGDSARTIYSLTTGPGIRNEVVVDFTGFLPGDSLFLKNRSTELPQTGSVGFIRDSNLGDSVRYYLKFNINGLTPQPPLGIVPASFPPLDTFAYDANTKRRTKTLIGTAVPNTTNVPFSINNVEFDPDVINDTILVNTTEVWTVYNQTTVAHPFHLHDVSFRVFQCDSISNGQSFPKAIPVEYMGPKDNILVPGNWSVQFATNFADFADSVLPKNCYMYHCHILQHEDGYYHGATFPRHGGMMGQFVVTTPALAQLPQTLGENIVIFPNPASNHISFKGENKVGSKVRIYDLQGRTLMEQDLKPFNGTTTMDVTALDAGMVLVEWQSTQGRFTKKIVLQ